MIYPEVIKAVVLYYPITTYRLRDAFDRHPVFPPTLILQGDSDSRARISDAEEVDRQIATRQSIHELHVYRGTDHGFNFREMNGYDASVAANAWQQTLAFLDSHLK
jgi:dienelactone hydrolase